MRSWMALVAATLLLASCGDDRDRSDLGARSESTPAPASVDEADLPALTPGGLAVGRLAVEGLDVDYVTIVPDGFELGDTAPVLPAFPPGGQDLALTQSVAAGTYLTEAVARGWVVVSPAAPGGRLFFDGSEALVPTLMDWIETWVRPEGDALHLAGVSNGGISTFRVAARNPERVSSILVFPGFPRSDEDKAALEQLTDVPVRMFVGGRDTGWIAPMQETLRTLTGLGGDATLEIVPDEGHIIASISDGVRIFDELDASR
ncbi:MAG: hypothetical protein ACE5GB_14335 [Acidimicrobiales bacterium]